MFFSIQLLLNLQGFLPVKEGLLHMVVILWLSAVQGSALYVIAMVVNLSCLN
jgi:hypothetical protein